MANYAAKGTLLKWTISTVLTTVAQVKSIRNARTNEVISTTHLASSAQGKLAGIPDHGEITLELGFDPADATHVALAADFASGTERAGAIVLSDAAPTTRTFNGFISSYEEGASDGDELTASVTIAVNGAVS